MVRGFLRAGLCGRSGLVELCFLRPVDRLLSLLQLPFRVSSDFQFLQIADLAGDLNMRRAPPGMVILLVVRPPYDRTTVVIVHQIPEDVVLVGSIYPYRTFHSLLIANEESDFVASVKFPRSLLLVHMIAY